jgi:hypothetical protein
LRGLTPGAYHFMFKEKIKDLLKKYIDSSLGKMLKNVKKEQMLRWSENNPDFRIRLFQFIHLQEEHSS